MSKAWSGNITMTPLVHKNEAQNAADDAERYKQKHAELLAAFKELDAALNKAWNERRLPWDVLTGEEVQRYKAAIAKAEQL